MAERKGGELAKRFVSALVLAPSALVLVHLGSPYFTALVAAAALVLTIEWSRLCDPDAARMPVAVMGICTVAAVILVDASLPIAGLGILVAGMIVTAAIVLLSRRNGSPPIARWLAAGVAYVGLPCLALVWLRGDDDAGRSAIYWLLAVVWAMDIGAYAFGRTIGGVKLAPAISPGKTWAGLLGGMACSALASVGVGFWLGMSEVAGEASGLGVLALAGALVGGVSQAGDLFESWVKRRFHAKDSGTIIPGHGGLLDRVDGLLAGAVAVVLYRLFGGSEILS